MVIEPVEMLGSTLGVEDKVKVELDYGTNLGSLNGSLEGYNYVIPYGSFLVDSLLYPSYGSFDGSNYVPPEGSLLGDPLEEAGCGSELWSLFEALIHCLDNHFWILHMAPLIVPMMSHHNMHCLEIYLRILALGMTPGAFLRPS